MQRASGHRNGVMSQHLAARVRFGLMKSGSSSSSLQPSREARGIPGAKARRGFMHALVHDASRSACSVSPIVPSLYSLYFARRRMTMVE